MWLKKAKLTLEKAKFAQEKEKVQRTLEKAKRGFWLSTIPKPLSLHHTNSMFVKVETNPLVIISGKTSKFAGRKYLKRIIP